MNKPGPCAIVILAAGASTRLGTPKQFLKLDGQTLISRLAEEANVVAPGQVIVVTGELHNQIEAELSGQNVILVHNADWQQGMGSSVAAGISCLQEVLPGVRGAVLAVCDQPFVTAEVLQLLIAEAENNSSIVASQYADTIGTPVLFPEKYFRDLLTLQGQEGAKKLMQKFQNQVITISFPLGHIDIDTPEDYENLLNS